MKNDFSSKTTYDCEIITQKAINKLAFELKNKNFLVFDSVLDNWINICGISEGTQRLLIIEALINGEESESLIHEYFESNYEYYFADRVKFTKKRNYGYIYTRYWLRNCKHRFIKRN